MNIQNKVKELPWHTSRVWQKRSVTAIKKVILHQELGEGPIENVNRYHITPGPNNHVSSRGCPHFCYHYGIAKDGEIIQANELSDITWHCKGQNEISVGIMLVGNFKGPEYDLGKEGPTEEQMSAMKWLVPHLLDMLKLSNQEVYGHYHYGKPACPGYAVMNYIEGIRQDISDEPKSKAIEKTTEEIQKRLKQLGYYDEAVDGVFGIQTASAIRRFQKDNGVLVDGIVGPVTWKTLLSHT